MTEAKAKLLYLGGSPEQRLLLNIQTEAGDFSQFEMSTGHLIGLILDGIKLLFQTRNFTR